MKSTAKVMLKKLPNYKIERWHAAEIDAYHIWMPLRAVDVSSGCGPDFRVNFIVF